MANLSVDVFVLEELIVWWDCNLWHSTLRYDIIISLLTALLYYVRIIIDVVILVVENSCAWSDWLRLSCLVILTHWGTENWRLRRVEVTITSRVVHLFLVAISRERLDLIVVFRFIVRFWFFFRIIFFTFNRSLCCASPTAFSLYNLSSHWSFFLILFLRFHPLLFLGISQHHTAPKYERNYNQHTDNHSYELGHANSCRFIFYSLCSSLSFHQFWE